MHAVVQLCHNSIPHAHPQLQYPITKVFLAMLDDPESVIAKLQRRLCMTQTTYILYYYGPTIYLFGKARTPTICTHLVQFVIQGNMMDVYSKI